MLLFLRLMKSCWSKIIWLFSSLLFLSIPVRSENTGGKEYTESSAQVPFGTWYVGSEGNTMLSRQGRIQIDSNETTSKIAGGLDYATSNQSTFASQNSVIINGGEVENQAYGGYARSQLGSATAANNTLTVNKGAIAAPLHGGFALGNLAVATDNQVLIQGGDIRADVHGGYANGYTGTAKNNTVYISGGNLNGNVYGGWASSGTAPATATHNTVVISGNPILNKTLYGGYIENGDTESDSITGNTLEVHGMGVRAENIKNFEHLHFFLSGQMQNGQTALTLTQSSGTDLTNGTKTIPQISVSVHGMGSPLRAGDKLNLIKNDAGMTTSTEAVLKASGTHGASLRYDFSMGQDANSWYAKVEKTMLNPQTKALAEGWLSSMALVRQGGDLIAEKAIRSAHQAISQTKALSPIGFAALSGDFSRYDTGSHIDMNSFSLLTGFALGEQSHRKDWMAGAFFEYGTGSYDTYNAFSKLPAVYGDGDAYYLGGGILGRIDFLQTSLGHFYTEASLRAGQLHQEWGSGDLLDATGKEASYKSNTPYYGMHMGVGFLFELNEKLSLDLYSKYFWTHQRDADLTLSTGEKLKFDAVDSHRVRFGSRVAYWVNENMQPYIGLAFEHEFDGKASGSIYGYELSRPDLSGNTGIGEVGLSFTPTEKVPLSIDMGVQGYVGMRNSVTGNLQVNWKF